MYLVDHIATHTITWGFFCQNAGRLENKDCFRFMFCIGIYGVGKAAVHQPALAILSHTPPGATETICWVGKGIVYDTGGLSIKGKVMVLIHTGPNPILHYSILHSPMFRSSLLCLE